MIYLEDRVQRLKDEIKSLKVSGPIAGSLIDTNIYTKTQSATYPDGSVGDYKIKFIPSNPENGLGITNIYTYCEALASSPIWSPDNPVFLAIDQGYYVNSNGEATFSDSFGSSGFGTFEIKVTVSVYSTVPGTIQITFS